MKVGLCQLLLTWTLSAASFASAQPQPPTGGGPRADTTTSLGQWTIASMPIANQQISVIADLPERAQYRICRNKIDTIGTGSSELYVHVDDMPLRSTGSIPTDTTTPFNNFSLDQGSCVVVAGKKFALAYSGSGGASMSNMLHGQFTRLRKDLSPAPFSEFTTWAMNWVKNETRFHDTVLVDQVAGQYRVCVASTETLPAGLGQVALGVEVDGNLVRFANSGWSFSRGCVDVAGQRIVLRQIAWPPGLTAFRVTGTLGVLAQ